MSESVNHIVTKDIEAEMLEQDLYQFENSPNTLKILKVIAAQKQRIWDTYVQIAEGFLIDNAVGNQLDIIGKLLGVPRTSDDDDAYRIILKIRGFRTRTHGTRSEIVDILSRFTGTDASSIDTYIEKNKGVTVAFFTGCLSEDASVEELNNLFPILTSYRLIAKSGRPFTLCDINDTPDTTYGLSDYYEMETGDATGGRLGSLIAASP